MKSAKLLPLRGGDFLESELISKYDMNLELKGRN